MTDDAKPAPGGAFTAEEERLHEEGFARIAAGLEAGEGFDEVCAGLEIDDPQFKSLVIDDFLKVSVAQRHFQGGESTEALAASLRIPVERVNRARTEMLAEVAARSVEVFRRQTGGGPPPGVAN